MKSQLKAQFLVWQQPFDGSIWSSLSPNYIDNLNLHNAEGLVWNNAA